MAGQLTESKTLGTQVKDMLTKSKQRIATMIGSSVDIDKVIELSAFAVTTNENLRSVTNPGSVVLSIAEIVKCGLEIGKPWNHAYLVPYKGVCTAILGYKGMIQLVMRTRKVKSWKANTVHAGDEYSFVDGDEARLVHVPSMDKDREKKTITHVYVIFYLVDGSIVRNVWDSARINQHRDQYSQGYRRAEDNGRKDSPWHTAWRQQAYKTLIRDLWNRGMLPTIGDEEGLILSDAAYDMEKKAPDDEHRTTIASKLTAMLTDESEPVIEPEPIDVTPEPQAEAGELSWDVESLNAVLAAATTISKVKSIRDRHVEACNGNQVDIDVVNSICDEREAALKKGQA